MNLRSFDLNLLISLDALLAERSVTRAAERVCVSQPTMSGCLQRLREHFADQLLIRVGREMELTPLARSLVIPVHEVLNGIQTTLNRKPTFDPQTAKRSFHICMTDYAAMVIMPIVLKRLAAEARYMSCHVEPLSEASFDRLSSGDLDFGIVADRWRLFGEHLPSAEIRNEALFSDDFVCIVDRDHPTVRDRLTLDDYKRLPHNLVRFGRRIESIVEHAWRLADLDLTVAATAPSLTSLVFMLPGTPNIATTQSRLARIIATSLPLKIFPCPLEIPPVNEALAYHSRHEFDPGHQFMRRVFIEAAAQLEQKTKRPAEIAR
jgi:LysR family transcriptional regulator, nod-box dependent transcriptional activator